MTSKQEDNIPLAAVERQIDAAVAEAEARMQQLIADLTSEKARIYAGLVAARTAIYQGAVRLPYPGKFGLQTILANMDKTINGEDR